eukprot:CAMPEP_0113624450 /NCGR_PEP_ID=MMETSP0017_2-20120614/12599_1 /TAXON_ID=2856 /ORGANISM="Cylindrotheca closterium" /LENGTH=742 /DNA_ID=CAMNT_0000534471 /DNA_START=37 /DNA_END=2262 /DNA_ORIENTATION=+ /assembly_acc=CAM_ASM_000147
MTRKNSRTKRDVTPATWCWNETPGQVFRHPEDSIVGDPNDGWIRYSPEDGKLLENSYLANKNGYCSLANEKYVVNFASMTQSNTVTGFSRDIKRIEEGGSRSVTVEATAVPVLTSYTPSSKAGGQTVAQLDFSVNLEYLITEHVGFLQSLHASGVTTSVSAYSLYRYRDLWLPLIAKCHTMPGFSMSNIVPPADVAWLWQVHRLAPERYRSYILSTFSSSGKNQGQPSSILDLQDPVNPFQFASDVSHPTNFTWTQLYPDDKFLFTDADVHSKAKTSKTRDKKTLIGGFDLLAAAKRQSTFLYQVQPMCYDISKVCAALEQYKLFLQIVPHHSKEQAKARKKSRYALVPTMDIDLMWHTHMAGATPEQYRKDCLAWCEGRTLNHDDSLDDRHAGGPNDVGFRKTADLWHRVHKDNSYAKRGGYRGEPPASWWPIAVAPAPLTSTTARTVPKTTTGPAYVAPGPVTSTTASAEPTSNEDPSAEPTSNEDPSKDPNKARWKIVVVCLIVAAIGLIFVASRIDDEPATSLSTRAYACGAEPTFEEIQARNVPVCVEGRMVNSYGRSQDVSYRPMCLKGGEDMDDPPVWCHQNDAEANINGADPTYWLFWSPCPSCGGTSWRMGRERTNDRSFYKLITSERPTFDSVPTPSSNSSWLYWDSSNTWVERQVDIVSCDDQWSGIPDACYHDKYYEESSIGWGLILNAVGIFGLGICCCFYCFSYGNCSGGGNGGHHSSGGGCSGGGGG